MTTRRQTLETLVAILEERTEEHLVAVESGEEMHQVVDGRSSRHTVATIAFQMLDTAKKELAMLTQGQVLNDR